jgi:glutamate-1-semialdehyde 2,1-aminomutase
MIESKSSATARPLGLHGISQTDESRRWFERAKKVLAGGISSSARATTTGPLPYPLYITRGQGSRIWDADGNEFIDYLLSYGSIVLGHSSTEITEAVTRQLESGTMYGTCNTVEVELAEQICKMVPCADLVRFANSGSEAIQGAIRAARGFTGKTKILKFEGHYHGWVDVLAVSNRPGEKEAGPYHHPNSQPHSLGLPPGVVADVIICPWNDVNVLRQILREHEFAAVIAEPIVANNACTMPAPGYQETLREECTKRGVLLIFDEIVTGFRVAPGGAQEFFKVIPDLAVFSKAVGGGFPLSAFAGRADIMNLVAGNTVKHGGTYNGNPVSAAAALATLKTLADTTVGTHLRKTGEELMEAIRRSSRDYRVPAAVQGQGSMFQVVFSADGKPTTQYRDTLSADAKRYAAFRQSLLEQGIHCNSSGLACWFISAAHTSEDVQYTVNAIDRAMKSVSQ